MKYIKEFTEKKKVSSIYFFYRNYETSHLLTETDTDNLIRLCFLYSPDKLDKHIIFQVSSVQKERHCWK